MSVIIIPRTHLRQPQERVAVNSDVWPGRSQVFLPSLRHSGIIGGIETLSLPSANQPFSKVGPLGIEHAWRPNTSTLPGESHGWFAGNFDVGQDASMIFVGARIDSLWAGIAYGGPSWGLWLGFDGSTVRAAYVDNPTTASYTATITSSGAGNGELFAVGLVKRGNTVKAITSRAVATTTGGNGGIRGSAGGGLYGQAAVVDGRIVYASTVLSAISSTPLSDAHMQDLLANPWQIFRADPIRIYSLPSGPISPTTTGTLSASETGADTAAVAGVVIVSGQLAVTESGNDTAAISGGSQITGSLSAQESGTDTADVGGSVIVAGVLSAAESGADAASASGAVTIAGALAATEQGADTASIVGGNILAGYMATQEAGSDTAAALGAVIVSGLAAASEAGADDFAASGSIGAADVIGNFAALESGADTISVSGVVIVSGALAAAEEGSDTFSASQAAPRPPPAYRTYLVPAPLRAHRVRSPSGTYQVRP